MPLPPDRGHIGTEQRSPQSSELDAFGLGDAIRLVIDDHRRVPEAVAEAETELAGFLAALVPRMRAGGRLIYVGAGTSGRLGVLDAAECPPTFQSDPEQVIGLIAGGDASLRHSSEGREDEPAGAASALDDLDLAARDTVLGIAAGGTTPYVLGAIEIAAGRGAMTALLSCAAPPCPPACDHLIVLDTGPELLTGSTRLKAGSATKLALNLITTIVFTQLGKVYSNLMVDLRSSNDKLRDRSIRILRELCPELDRAGAAIALERAGDRLKIAIVMQRLGLDAIAAEARLGRHDGRLRPLLDDSI